MKKNILSAGVILLFVFYVIFQQKNNTSAQLPLAIVPVSVSPTPTPTPTASGGTPSAGDVGGTNPSASTPTATPKITATPTPTVKGQYTDGTYTGNSVDVFYGNVQVAAVISGGKLTDVKFLDYPQDRGESRQISSRSLPQLRQEAITTQSANVNTVSGATMTSEGFKASMASALSQAK